MCGFVGIATTVGRPLSLSDEKVKWMRDLLVHRGVDDAGLWRAGHVAFGHRRLAIVDAAHGRQPWIVDDGDAVGVLNYNGQLYNWLALREQLRAEGVVFRTDSDTEVVAWALKRWGTAALARFRGMFALAWYDAAAETLLLARDPMGIKPLYYARASVGGGGRELVFGSEPMGVLGHPSLSMQPDWVTVSAYLTTIRTTLGRRTLFEGLSTLLPGEYQVWDLRADTLSGISAEIPPPSMDVAEDYVEAMAQLSHLMRESVDLHLMGDADPAAFLSGGLDSAIITRLAADRIDPLHTYAAASGDESGDARFSRLMATELDTRHTLLEVRPEEFREVWGGMISALGVPLGTPNEVAIFGLSLAASGSGKVILSGEGADELFGGYGPPLNRFARYLADHPAPTGEGLVAEYLDSVTWVGPQQKTLLLAPEVWAAAEGDQPLRDAVRAALIPADGRPADLRTFLDAQRRFNLTGLLGRLDTATMLANIEGRTPFADAHVAAFAERLPMDFLFRPGDAEGRTKRILREAFATRLPESVVRRPKASFPLPFQGWLNDQRHWLSDLPVAHDVFRRTLLRELALAPADNWLLAWPLMNISYWLEWHWGSAERLRAA
ncbi:MAG: asparagine synthase (glutamine-hydrolyzing) [Gammaproteobacteria bacterium]